MEFRQSIPLDWSFRLINHGPTVLISAEFDGVRNIMAGSWCMPIDYLPPRVAIALDKRSWTRGMIEKSGEFAISVPTCSQLGLLHAIGTTSGKEIYEQTKQDKLTQLGIKTISNAVVKAPLIAGCAAWLECRLISEPLIQEKYDLFIGEVVEASADRRVFHGGSWDFSTYPDLRTLHYESGGTYMVTGDAIKVR